MGFNLPHDGAAAVAALFAIILIFLLVIWAGRRGPGACGQ